MFAGLAMPCPSPESCPGLGRHPERSERRTPLRFCYFVWWFCLAVSFERSEVEPSSGPYLCDAAIQQVLGICGSSGRPAASLPLPPATPCFSVMLSAAKRPSSIFAVSRCMTRGSRTPHRRCFRRGTACRDRRASLAARPRFASLLRFRRQNRIGAQRQTSAPFHPRQVTGAAASSATSNRRSFFAFLVSCLA